MQLRKTPLRDLFVVGIEPHHDLRGFFARTWCAREFAAHGLTGSLVQTSISRNERRGTVRGMHMQLPPSREAKLVRCTRGAIYDVVIDLDPQSPSYLRHFEVELSAEGCDALYIPALMLHGFQTLEDGSEVLYQMTDFYAPDLGYGARWDDPAFGIAWPIRDSITILPRDEAYGDFDRDRYPGELAAARSRTAAAAEGRSMSALLLEELQTTAECRALADEAWQMMEALYPICRSITGEGVRRTLGLVAGQIPLAISEVASGTPVFDWEVPNEWNVREAWIENSAGRRIVDLRNHTLHLMSYSTPVQATMSLGELRPHLHTMPAHPDWIPYRTSYYKEGWGFCLAHSALLQLDEGPYRVFIDSTLAPGHLTYAECLIPGATDEEFLIFTHTCHPALCNDNLTGIALATLLARQLARSQPRLTYRFVFAPGTIGSITWLARNEHNLHRVRHGLVIGLLGDRGPLTYKRSRRLHADIDQIAALVLKEIAPGARLTDFSPYGYDERQLCSPGFNLPVGRLTRTPNNEYPQYHSSADDFLIIDRDSLAESLRACASILRVADRNERYVNLNPKCEPRLGKRGLYRSTGGAHPGEFEHALLWILNQSDGSASLLQIAERSGLSFAALAAAADALQEASLLRPA